MAKDNTARSFRYERRSKESVKERANMRGGNFDSFVKGSIKRYKMRDGKNLIRILPPTWPKPAHYGYDMWVKYDIGVDNQSYLSLSKMKNEADPLDEARREAAREGDEKLAKALQPRQRIAMWVIDRLDEDEGPQFFDAPFTLDKAFANLSIDQDTGEVIYVDDPAEGCDIRFYKEGKGKNTKYDASKMRLLKPSLLHEDDAVAAEWMVYAKANPVPDCLNYYDYEHIAASFNGQAGTRDDEDETVTTRTARQPAAKEPSRAKQVTHRVSDENAETGDGDRGEVPPKSKPSRARAQVDEDDNEEPEPEVKPRGESIRDRLARRRPPPPDEDDEVEEED